VSKPLAVGLGQATVAFMGEVLRLPDDEHREELSAVSVQAGGAAAIAMVTVKTLGCAARLCTQLAEDFLAPFVTRAIEGVGVDLRAIHARTRRLTAFSFDAVTEDRTRRASFSTSGDVGYIDPDDLDPDELLDGASALLLDGFFPMAQTRVAEAARSRGIPVIFDGASLREGTGELVALADVLICSERFASELAPRGELKDSLVELQRLGPRAVILTLSSSGSIGLHGDQLVEQPAFEVDVVDASGAGDIYHGAFVAALLNELPFARCMEFASAAASLSCRAFGAWAGIPNREEVVDLIRASRD